MQKIIIKNFGPITNAEILLKKTVVLIGEQASGKSTIAKLIYYFKSLREDLFNKIYNESFNEKKFEFSYPKFLILPARNKFYNFFGSTLHLRDFEITFYYSIEEDKFLRLTLNEEKKLNVFFSDSFNLSELSWKTKGIRNLLPENFDKENISDILAFNQERLKYAERLSGLLKDFFCCQQDENLFIVAGRNSTVGYSESFEKNFLLDKQKSLEDSYKKQQQTIDETLMIDFMNRVVGMKDVFKKFGEFDNYLKIIETRKKGRLKNVIEKINQILHGNYHIDNWGEKIIFNQETGEYVYLSNASSGQQEVIRILQDVFLTISQSKKVLRIVEEPEAHLFPIAQKQVIELLVQMAKCNEDNQLIITTHSPYVLTVFNNILFAKRVIANNPSSQKDVSKIIDSESLLDSYDFSAYVLAKNGDGIFSESIIDEETGLICQNYLDTVSEILANEFNLLYDIHAKSFLR